jgi:hypothetical protein
VKLAKEIRDPDAGTQALDSRYLEKATHHNREFQQFSIDNEVYFAPVDEAGQEEKINRQMRQSNANPCAGRNRTP